MKLVGTGSCDQLHLGAGLASKLSRIRGGLNLELFQRIHGNQAGRGPQSSASRDRAACLLAEATAYAHGGEDCRGNSSVGTHTVYGEIVGILALAVDTEFSRT